jgi:hypothetical protein
MGPRNPMKVGDASSMCVSCSASQQAASISADIELSGIIFENAGVWQEAMRLNTAPQRPRRLTQHLPV